MSAHTKAAHAANREKLANGDIEEAQSLLSVGADGEELEPIRVSSRSPSRRPSPLIQPPRRQSSLAQPRPDGTPRTPNRVQFNDSPTIRTLSPRQSMQAESEEQAWLEEQDYLSGRGDRRRDTARLPLLTDIEAPSVTLAEEFNAEDLLESARPKSGMRSAFMNMANSIM